MLAARLQRSGTVHILGNSTHLERIGEWLWEYETTAFVPHTVGEPDAGTGCRIVLWATQPMNPAPWLISLHTQPVDINGCRNIIEIVTVQPEHRERSRRLWRHYEAAGCLLHRYDLNHNQLPEELP